MKQLSVPKFSIQRELGKGGSATVYLAVHEDGKEFALKVFHASPSPQNDLKRRLLGEFRAASSATSTNIVRVHDLLEIDGQSILVMNYIDGSDLTNLQTRLPYVLPEVSVLIAIEILKTLEQVHERGIIHRDLKPSNILVDAAGKIFLTDFGLAKWNDASAQTMHGMILGSPDFMSPEQARGDIVDESTDLFSLASILYFLVTGTRPFARTSALAVIAAVIKGDFEAAHRRNPKISPALSKIIQRGLALDPGQRFTSAKDFRTALENYLASVGLAENFTFLSWFQDSSETTMSALRVLAETLAKRARNSLNEKKWDEATEFVSHLSLVAPESILLKRLIEELHQRQQRRSMWPLLLVPACAMVFAFLYFSGKSKVPPSSVATDTMEAIVAAPAVPPTAPKASISSVNVSKSRIVKEQPVHLEVPSDVEVEWDGRAVEADKALTAKPGIYTIVLHKRGYQPIRRKVEVKESEPTVIRVN